MASRDACRLSRAAALRGFGSACRHPRRSLRAPRRCGRRNRPSARSARVAQAGDGPESMLSSSARASAGSSTGVCPPVTTCRRPRHRVDRVDRHDLAVPQPYEEVAQHRRQLLDRGRGQLARRRLSPGGDMHRLYDAIDGKPRAKHQVGNSLARPARCADCARSPRRIRGSVSRRARRRWRRVPSGAGEPIGTSWLMSFPLPSRRSAATHRTKVSDSRGRRRTYRRLRL
jgi:hypothetical protein